MRLSESEFLKQAEEAIRKGPAAQAEFMLDQLAKMPHSHTADEILDFDEAVTQIVEDTGEEEEEDI